MRRGGRHGARLGRGQIGELIEAAGLRAEEAEGGQDGIAALREQMDTVRADLELRVAGVGEVGAIAATGMAQLDHAEPGILAGIEALQTFELPGLDQLGAVADEFMGPLEAARQTLLEPLLELQEGIGGVRELLEQLAMVSTMVTGSLQETVDQFTEAIGQSDTLPELLQTMVDQCIAVAGASGVGSFEDLHRAWQQLGPMIDDATAAAQERIAAGVPADEPLTPSAMGNQAVGRLARTVTDHDATAEAGLSPVERQIIAASVLPQLEVFVGLIGPGMRRPQIALAVNHLKPALTALQALEPAPFSDAARTIAEVVRLLSLWEAALTALVLRGSLTTVATPWAAALNHAESLLRWLQENDAPHRRQELRLLEGSIVPSIRNALQELTTPEVDLAGVLERNRPTYEAILAVGQQELQAPMREAAEQFHTGLAALEANVVGREVTLSDATSLTEWARRTLEELAEGEEPDEPPASRFGRLIWPHFGRLIWPHLRPIVTGRFWLLSSQAGGRRGDGFPGGAV